MGTESKTNIADQIKVECARRSVTVLTLAERTLIPRTTLQRRLSGKSPFTIPELEAVSDALDIPFTFWFGVAA